MIDFHTHLDLYPDAVLVARETSLRNEFTLAVTTSPKAWAATSRVLGEFPNVRIALGLHPEIADAKKSERELLVESVRKAEFIGETGLDGSSRYKETFKLQCSIFCSLLEECAAQGGRIISIHSRGAATHVLNLLDKYPGAGVPILHWFSGNSSELKRAVDRGCWFSVGPAMSGSSSGKRILKNIPLCRILPESDGPFAKLGGDPIMPWEASSVSNEIARSRNLKVSEINDQFRINTKEVLSILKVQN